MTSEELTVTIGCDVGSSVYDMFDIVEMLTELTEDVRPECYENALRIKDEITEKMVAWLDGEEEV